MKKIIGIGNALVDIVTIIEDDSLLELLEMPRGSMQLVDQEQSVQIKEYAKNFNPSYSAGGSAANTIHGLGMLGIEAGFIGMIGRDNYGDYFNLGMKEAGVSFFLKRSNTVTGTSTVLVSPDSERTFATHLGAALEISADDIEDSSFEGYDTLYLEGYLIPNRPLIRRVCDLASRSGMEIAVDLASYNVVEENRLFFMEIIREYVDILFANEEEAAALTGMSAEDALEEISTFCRIAIVKRGKKGSLIKCGEEMLKIGALDAECIDTTGAGDLFASGFLYGYANGMSLEKCGLAASLLAGNIIQVVGAKMDNERWKAIRSYIKEITDME